MHSTASAFSRIFDISLIKYQLHAIVHRVDGQEGLPHEADTSERVMAMLQSESQIHSESVESSFAGICTQHVKADCLFNQHWARWRVYGEPPHVPVELNPADA